MRQNWTLARDFGRLLSNLTYLTEATASDLSTEDVIPILNVNAIRAGEQPKRVTVGLLSSLIDAANGLPSGGTTGQVLSKIDSTDYNAEWVDPSESSPGGTSGQLQFNDGGSFSGVASSSVDVDGNVTIRTATVNAPSGYTGNLLDLQVDTARQLAINETGQYVAYSSGYNASHIFRFANANTIGSAGLSIWNNGGQHVVLGYGATNNANTNWLSLSPNFTYVKALGFSTVAQNAGDLTLERDAADTLAQRRTTNAQTYRVYNTYTSSTNFERANLGWSGNVFLVGTEKGSAGGTARQLEFQTDGTSKVAITTDGKVGIGTTSPSASLELDAPSGYTGNLLDLQVDGTSKFTVDENGNLINGSAGGGSPAINPFLLMGA